MTYLNVIDLDNTLIPYDTSRNYIISRIKSGDFIFFLFTILRKLRILGRSRFSQIIYESVNRCDKNFLDRFIKFQIINIDSAILNKVKEHSPSGQKIINVLCSASPSIFVIPIAESLGYIGIGSGFINGNYMHMYGNQKKITINKRFPVHEYDYNFAISDCISDINLLLCFKDYCLYKRQNIISEE